MTSIHRRRFLGFLTGAVVGLASFRFMAAQLGRDIVPVPKIWTVIMTRTDDSTWTTHLRGDDERIAEIEIASTSGFSVGERVVIESNAPGWD